MIVGVPKEIKQDEYRVAMLPVGVEELVRRGHQVLIEAGAGLGSGLPDHDYLQSGAEMVSALRSVRSGFSWHQKRSAATRSVTTASSKNFLLRSSPVISSSRASAMPFSRLG